MSKIDNTTRYFSNIQEETICKLLGAKRTPNSGGTKFSGGDAIQKDASLLIECKTCESLKKSFSIKKEWILKNKEEAFFQRLDNYCLAFNFGPTQENYFVINEKLMKFLVEKLIEENS